MHKRKLPDVLQQAKLPIMDRSFIKGREQVLAGFGVKGKANMCSGDSGGPLNCQRADGSWQVEGAASWMYKGCSTVSAYAPLNKYLSWVKQYVTDL